MSEPVERRPCKACGMPIEIHLGPNGKPIPLQRIRSFYALADPLHGGTISRLELAPGIEAGFVSHFETCPSANQFSKNRSAKR